MEHGERKGDEASSNHGARKEKEKKMFHTQIAQNPLWNKRPDVIAFKMPTKTKADVTCLMEFKCMSDVTNRYVVRAKCVTEEQNESLRSALSNTIQHPGWIVEQISFIAGARSLNEEDLK